MSLFSADGLLSPTRRAIYTKFCFWAGMLLVGFSAPMSSEFCIAGLCLAGVGVILNPAPPRQLFSGRWFRPILPLLIAGVGVLVLMILQTVLSDDHFSLLPLGLTTRLVPLVTLTALGREYKVRQRLSDGLAVGCAVALAFGVTDYAVSPYPQGLTPFVFLSAALLLDELANRAISSTRRWVVIAELAFLFALYFAFGQSLSLLVLPFALLVGVGRLIALIRYPIGRLSLWVVLLIGWLGMASYVSHVGDVYFVNSPKMEKPLCDTTVNGNRYSHDTLSNAHECGYPTYAYVCKEELEAGWVRVSSVPLTEVSRLGTSVGDALIRYLTSRGFRKDSVGISLLSPEEITAIERGVYNWRLRGKGAIYRELWQECQAVENYMQRGALSTDLTVIIAESRMGMRELASVPWYGIDRHDTLRQYPHAIGFVQGPLALGLIPWLLLCGTIFVWALLAGILHGRWLGFSLVLVAIFSSLVSSGLLLTPFVAINAYLLTRSAQGDEAE